MIAAFQGLDVKKDSEVIESETEEMPKCPYCGKTGFGLKNPKSGLSRHINSKHKVEKLAMNEGFKCPIYG